jgi:CheY-like chemotaxis protein
MSPAPEPVPSRRSAAAAPRAGEAAATQKDGRKGPRVLVIEDNRDAAESLCLLLKMWGHEVEVAMTGVDGLAAARRFVPAVVFCDLGLPGALDGLAVARQLRAEALFAGLRLVALTGSSHEEDKARARAAGFDQHLTKPVDPAALRQWLGPAAS